MRLLVIQQGILISRTTQDVDNGQQDANSHTHGHAFLDQVIVVAMAATVTASVASVGIQNATGLAFPLSVLWWFVAIDPCQEM
jgi:hypothetical protein